MARVLIADDDPFLLKIYSTRLTQDGHEVMTASDGQTALEMAISEKPDLLVLDIMLPRLNGLDVLTELKSNSAANKIAVVFLSNLAQPEEQEEAQKRGADEFLIKARLTPSQVVEALQKYTGPPVAKKEVPKEKAEKKTAAPDDTATAMDEAAAEVKPVMDAAPTDPVAAPAAVAPAPSAVEMDSK